MGEKPETKERPMFRREKDTKIDNEGLRRMREAIRQRIDQEEGATDDETTEEPSYRSPLGSSPDPEPYTPAPTYEPLSREPRARERESLGREPVTREPDYSFLSTPRQERSITVPAAPATPQREEADWQEEAAPQQPAVTTIAADTAWRGTLRSTTSIAIEGSFEGEIYTDQQLHIAPDAHVEATVHAGSIVVAGQLNGQINCRERLEVLPTGRVSGQIDAGLFIVQEGAYLGGHVRMRAAGASSFDDTDESRPPLQRVR